MHLREGGKWLDGQPVSLLALCALGIDVCIISNYENVTSYWCDPRRHCAYVNWLNMCCAHK